MPKKSYIIISSVSEIREGDRIYELYLKDGHVLYAPKEALKGIKVKVEDVIRLSFVDSTIDNVFINDQQVYKQKFLFSREEDKIYHSLPPVLKNVVDQARKFDSKHTPQETLFICNEALKIANQLKTRSAIDKFFLSPEITQLEMVHGLSDTLDNLQLTAACAYAYVVVRTRLNEQLLAKQKNADRSRD